MKKEKIDINNEMYLKGKMHREKLRKLLDKYDAPSRGLMLFFGLGVLIATFLMFSPGQCASANAPADFCYVQSWSIQNSSTQTFTEKPVRIVYPYNSLNSAGQIGGINGWGFYMANTSFDEIEVMEQGLTSSVSPFWAIIPSLAGNNTQSYFTYTGNNSIQRDNGIYFSGNDYARIPNSAGLQPSNNFSVWLDLEIRDINSFCSSQTSTWVSKYDATTGTGYGIEYECNSSPGTIRGIVGTSLANTSSVTGSLNFQQIANGVKIELNYDNSNNLNLLFDGQSVSSVTTSFLSIVNNTNSVKIGDNIDAGIIRNAGVISNNIPVSTWTFDPDGMEETSAVAPVYQGTFNDAISSNNGTYYFNRDITNVVVSPGTVQDIDADTLISLNQAIKNVVGDPQIDLTTSQPLASFMPFYGILSNFALNSGVSQLGYAVIFLGIGFFLLMLMVVGTNSMALGIAGFMFPTIFGAVFGLYAPFYVVLWAFFLLFSLGAFAFVKESF